MSSNMNECDIQLMCLSKSPIYVDDVPIYPITINQIASMKYSEYIRSMKFFCLNKSDIGSLLNIELADDKEVFDYLFLSAINNNTINKSLLSVLGLVCHKDLIIDRQKSCFLSNDFIVNRNNFASIQQIVRKRNCLQDIKEEQENPANDKARELLEKKRKLNKKIQQQKSHDSGITLGDLVSILSSGLQLPLEVVMEYDMYQFNDQFNRLKIFREYEINVQALLHGADSKNIELKSWISKIDDSEED